MSHAGRKPSTWQTSLLSHTFLPGSSERLWHGSTRPVHLDHTATGLLVTVCLLLSALTPSPFGALPPLWSNSTELDVMMQGHNTHNYRFKYTQTSTKKMERREKDSQSHAYWIWQSIAGFEKACVWPGGECKAGFTTNPENEGYWIISWRESWAETLTAKTESSSEKQNVLELNEKLPRLKTSNPQKSGAAQTKEIEIPSKE